jgi:hypothetical protein
MPSFRAAISSFIHLIKEAVHDYHDSRGNAHLAILLSAKKKLHKQGKTITKQKESLGDQLKFLEKNRDLQMLIALEKYLAENAYLEISTISKEQWRKIYLSFFKGHLDDIEKMIGFASVSESQIMETKTIIKSYKHQLGHYLAMDFPGKREIINQYVEEKKLVLEELAQLNKRLFLCDRNLNRCKLAIFTLKKVSVIDFILWAFGRAEYSQKVNDYSTGLFCEWDSIPGWFREIISSPEEINAFQAS